MWEPKIAAVEAPQDFRSAILVFERAAASPAPGPGGNLRQVAADRLTRPAMVAETSKVHAIYRYPVKGLSPEPLEQTTLTVRETLPADRLYAVENGPSGFDPAAPRHQPKQRYLMLMRNERLARLHTRFDDASHTLVIRLEGREAARGDLRTPGGRATVEGFFSATAPTSCAGRRACSARRASAFPTSHTRWSRSSTSLRWLRSKASSACRSIRCAFAATSTSPAGRPGVKFDLVGQEIAIGPRARLKILKQIVRCAATNVDPDTGIRDLAIPNTLMKSFGHGDCGVYGEVVDSGPIAVGDNIVAAPAGRSGHR